jgi:hypothetical protein
MYVLRHPTGSLPEHSNWQTLEADTEHSVLEKHCKLQDVGAHSTLQWHEVCSSKEKNFNHYFPFTQGQHRVHNSSPEDEQVMLETCRGLWFSINWMESASRWFHYTDVMWCTVSKTLSSSPCLSVRRYFETGPGKYLDLTGSKNRLEKNTRRAVTQMAL